MVQISCDSTEPSKPSQIFPELPSIAGMFATTTSALRLQNYKPWIDLVHKVCFRACKIHVMNTSTFQKLHHSQCHHLTSHLFSSLINVNVSLMKDWCPLQILFVITIGLGEIGLLQCSCKFFMDKKSFEWH